MALTYTCLEKKYFPYLICHHTKYYTVDLMNGLRNVTFLMEKYYVCLEDQIFITENTSILFSLIVWVYYIKLSTGSKGVSIIEMYRGYHLNSFSQNPVRTTWGSLLYREWHIRLSELFQVTEVVSVWASILQGPPSSSHSSIACERGLGKIWVGTRTPD